VFAAMIADVDEVWRDLFDIARDPSIQQEVRASSLFWLGQEAGDAVTTGIAAIAADEREEQEVREAAIFALSQRAGDVGVQPLMELARTAREAETRRAAMFWLAQSEDPRVLAFFEEILLGR
jgi:HEAT repeat protein